MICVGVTQHQTKNSGGIATYARGLIDGLGSVMSADIEIRPVAVPRGPQSALTRVVWEQIRVPSAAREVDVLHMTDFRVPIRRGAPVVGTIHDVSFITHPGLLAPSRRRYKRAAFALMLAHKPELIACVSAYTLSTLVTVAPSIASRCVLLSPGVASPPATFRRSATPDLMLTVGLTGRRKNLHVLLRAYRRARAAGFSLRWIAIGQPGPGDAELVRSLQATEGVTLAGYVSRDQLERYWSSAAFIAVPSVVEGFSYPVVEAMQRGVPVIASLGSALDETAGEAAWRFDADDESALVEALLRLGDDAAERARLAERGLVHAQRFSWERRAPAFVDAYRTLMA